MGEQIHLRYDDGFPEGFSLLDNRDLWDGTGRYRKALLRPATLGVYVLMCSLPRDWVFREAWLTGRLGIGRDALRRIVRELIEAGRLRKDEIRDEKGRYIRTEWALLRGGSPRTGNPSTAKPTAGKSASLLNTESAVSTERTTTTRNTPDMGANGLLGLDQVVVARKLKGLDLPLQQSVLDELAGCIEDGKATSPLGLLDRLVQAVRDGNFNLSRGLRVEAERKQRLTAEARASTYRIEAIILNAENDCRLGLIDKQERDRRVAEVRRQACGGRP